MESTLSIIITVLFGFIANKTNILDSKNNASINKLIIKLTLPASIFHGMLFIDSNKFHSLITNSTNIILLIAFLLLSSYIISLIIFKDKILSMTIAMLIALPGVLFYGLPILTPILNNKTIITISATGIAQNLIVLPFVFTIFSRHKGGKFSYKSLILEPIIITPILAIVLILLKINLPEFFMLSLDQIGRCTTGLALISTGVILSQVKIRINRKIISFVIFKNFALPIVTLYSLKLTSLRPEYYVPLVLINAIPIGSICIIISNIYDIYVKEVSAIVTLSVLLSSISIPIILALL
ncbi:AEC family transporter [Vibrio gazogenes]|uniref:Predicted permease n=1 Tax=Vibrio gazogenes DSM 21264 = NBRC 103151 TaxID=1123492 RepID=A0A1M5F019_VIBGA|nr:AEC family transporter [Vibrio gazogenes]USP14751.1 AEC family transporter [Vibrio gazogenes]SHF84768.1 Predicted permease [Vibrio gazogenes DSM 21264] [Vibrio gazogenes DSM 21264 = NBRC 103151]SJN55107.1 putative transporter YfdV [Vibrio gazogenes]